jgi:menaquinone-dependent protoporphyrinogen oxidase
MKYLLSTFPEKHNAMPTLIVYTSHHGTTGKIASMLAGRTGAKAINLRDKPWPDLAAYDRIILAASIHAGNIGGTMKAFLKQNMIILLQKPTGIILCGMNEPEFQAQYERNFPELLRNHVFMKHLLCGEFLFDRMNFFERLIVRKISGIKASLSKLDEAEIERIAENLNATNP